MSATEAEKQGMSLPKRLWAALSVLIAAGAVHVLSYDGLLAQRQLPGFGFVGMMLCLWAAVLIALGRKAVWCRESSFLALADGLLILTYGVFDNLIMRLLNLLPVLVLTSLAFAALAGRGEGSVLTAEGMRRTALRLFPALFAHAGKPLAAAAALGCEQGKMRNVLLGLGTGAVLLIPVLYLFSSADAVFAGLLADVQLLRDPVWFLWNVLRFLCQVLMPFSVCFALTRAARPIPALRAHRVPAETLTMILLLLSAACGVFVYIQLRYLFMGTEAVTMLGGYAEYARGGFFQLVFVALLNLSLTAWCLSRSGGSRMVRLLSAVMTMLTAVILFSAFFRMRMYVEAFGLSLLRLLTLFGMAVILVGLLLTLLRIVRLRFAVLKPLFICTACLWLVFCWMNPAAVITSWNLRHNHAPDRRYLYDLGKDAWGCLPPDMLAEAEAIQAKEEEDWGDRVTVNWYTGCLHNLPKAR